METKTLSVPNISCHHCTNTIRNELSELSGVSAVEADVDTRKVTVTWEAPASLDAIVAALREINYPAAES
jgi:copper ion binding protein